MQKYIATVSTDIEHRVPRVEVRASSGSIGLPRQDAIQMTCDHPRTHSPRQATILPRTYNSQRHTHRLRRCGRARGSLATCWVGVDKAGVQHKPHNQQRNDDRNCVPPSPLALPPTTAMPHRTQNCVRALHTAACVRNTVAHFSPCEVPLQEHASSAEMHQIAKTHLTCNLLPLCPVRRCRGTRSSRKRSGTHIQNCRRSERPDQCSQPALEAEPPRKCDQAARSSKANSSPNPRSMRPRLCNIPGPLLTHVHTT